MMKTKKPECSFLKRSSIMRKRAKISSLMGDFGKGLSAFKKGVSSDNPEQNTAQGQPGDSAKPIEAQASTASPNQARQDNTAKV